MIEGERDGIEGSRRASLQIPGGAAVRVVSEPRHRSLVVRVVGLRRRSYCGQVVGEVCHEVVLVGMRGVVGVELRVPGVVPREVVVEAACVRRRSRVELRMIGLREDVNPMCCRDKS